MSSRWKGREGRSGARGRKSRVTAVNQLCVCGSGRGGEKQFVQRRRRPALCLSGTRDRTPGPTTPRDPKKNREEEKEGGVEEEQESFGWESDWA